MTPMKKLKDHLNNFHKILNQSVSVYVSEKNGRDYKPEKEVDWTYYREKKAILTDHIKIFTINCEERFSFSVMFDYENLKEEEQMVSFSIRSQYEEDIFSKPKRSTYKESMFSKPISLTEAKIKFKTLNKTLKTTNKEDFFKVIKNTFISESDIEFKKEFDQIVHDFLNKKKEALNKVKKEHDIVLSQLKINQELFTEDYQNSDEVNLVKELEEQLKIAKQQQQDKKRELDKKFKITELINKLDHIKANQRQLQYETSPEHKFAAKHARRSLLKNKC